jgi:hypothetical protein
LEVYAWLGVPLLALANLRASELRPEFPRGRALGSYRFYF